MKIALVTCMALSAVTINAAEIELKKSADAAACALPALTKEEAMFPNIAQSFKALASQHPKERADALAIVSQKVCALCASLTQSPETAHLPKLAEEAARHIPVISLELVRLESQIKASAAFKDLDMTMTGLAAPNPLQKKVDELEAKIKEQNYELEQLRAALCS